MWLRQVKQARFDRLHVEQNLVISARTNEWSTEKPLTCSAPILRNGLDLMTACVKRLMTTLYVSALPDHRLF
jgi:hypothetical protein